MKRYFRGICVIFLFALFGICALLLRYFVFPFQKSKKENYNTLHKSWKFFIWLISAMKIIKVDNQDSEKIKNIKNSIIVSTHPSFIDIVILMSIIPDSTCFVARKLGKNPFFKGMVELLFVLDSNDIEKWVNESCEKLNEGLNLIIFPMGTRHDNNEHPKIKRGTALIAQKSGKDIVALDIKTSARFLQVRQPIYDASDDTIIYTIKYLDKINIREFYKQSNDEVTSRSEITKSIAKILYKK